MRGLFGRKATKAILKYVGLTDFMSKKVRCIENFACFHAGNVYCVGSWHSFGDKWFRKVYEVYLGEEPNGACREVLDIDLQSYFEEVEDN